MNYFLPVMFLIRSCSLKKMLNGQFLCHMIPVALVLINFSFVTSHFNFASVHWRLFYFPYLSFSGCMCACECASLSVCVHVSARVKVCMCTSKCVSALV